MIPNDLHLLLPLPAERPNGHAAGPPVDDLPVVPLSDSGPTPEDGLRVPKPDPTAAEPDVLAAIGRLRELEEACRVRIPVRREVTPGQYVEVATFTIQPLPGDRIEALQERCMKWQRDASGKRHERVLDLPRFSSWLIVEATVAEDRARWWENPDVRARYGVASSLDVVTRVLAGAKQTVAMKVMEISGFDAALEDVLSSS